MFPEYNDQVMRRYFPHITREQYKITSPEDGSYNCAAWAVGDTNHFIDPIERWETTWPQDVPRERTLTAFMQLYESYGYEVCTDSNYEDGFEKICIYIKNGVPSHISKQKEAELWSSKIGRSYDIQHAFDALSGETYGWPDTFMKRRNN